MTSVNNRPQSPYTGGYNVPQTSAPTRHEESAEASAPASNAPAPRAPVTPEQRGQFSSHSKIVNQQPQTVGSDQLAELSKKSQELRGKYQALIAEFAPVIQKLQQQIADLTQQLKTSNKPTQETNAEVNSEQKIAPAEDQTGVQPETAPEQNAPTTSSERPPSLAQMTRANDEFREMVKQMFEQFTMIVKELKQQIESLAQLINTPGTGIGQTPAKQPDTSVPETSKKTDATAADTSPQKPVEHNEASPSNETPPAPSRSVDELHKENQELEAALDYMSEQFKQVLSQLQKEVETLTQKIGEQHK